jgi:hypothetical protein
MWNFGCHARVFLTRRQLLPRHRRHAGSDQGLSLLKLPAEPRDEQPKMSDGKLNKKRSHSDSDSEAVSRPKIKYSNSTTVVTDELGMPELRQKALYVDHYAYAIERLTKKAIWDFKALASTRKN